MNSSVFNHINEANKITPISCFYIFPLFPRVPLTRYSPRKCNQNVWFHFMVVGCLLAPSYIFHVSLALQTNLVIPLLQKSYEYMQNSIRLNTRYLLSLNIYVYVCVFYFLIGFVLLPSSTHFSSLWSNLKCMQYHV